MSTIYIGLTGLPAAGKGEFVRLVQEFCNKSRYLFVHHSLSDVLREQARAQGLPVERHILHDLGNSLRAARGGGALAEIVASQLSDISSDPETVVVIDAIRTPDEVEVLRKRFGKNFLMVAVIAPPEVLTSRIASRSRADEFPGAAADINIARHLLSMELGENEPSFGLNIKGAIDVSDETIINGSSLNDLRCKVQGLLSRKIDQVSAL